MRGSGAELGVLKVRARASDAGRWHLTRAGGRGGAEVRRLQGASSEPTAGSSGLRPCGPGKKRSREAPWPEPAQTEVPPPCLRPGQTQCSLREAHGRWPPLFTGLRSGCDTLVSLLPPRPALGTGRGPGTMRRLLPSRGHSPLAGSGELELDTELSCQGDEQSSQAPGPRTEGGTQTGKLRAGSGAARRGHAGSRRPEAPAWSHAT